MKGYNKPKKLVTGTCFICGTPCTPEHYAHYECSLNMSEARDKLIKESRYIEENKVVTKS